MDAAQEPTNLEEAAIQMARIIASHDNNQLRDDWKALNSERIDSFFELRAVNGSGYKPEATPEKIRRYDWVLTMLPVYQVELRKRNEVTL